MPMVHYYYLIILAVYQVLSEENSYYITELKMPSFIPFHLLTNHQGICWAYFFKWKKESTFKERKIDVWGIFKRVQSQIWVQDRIFCL